MFDANSRYASAPTWQVVDRRGRTVTVVGPPVGGPGPLLGIHVRKDGQRLDILAGRYFRDATQWWRLPDQAEIMIPEALSLADEIDVPEAG